MAYDPRNDPKLPDCSDEAPKFYDLLDERRVRVAVWSGEGQLSGVKINGQPPTEDAGVFTLDLGTAEDVMGTIISVDAQIAKTNAATANGSLTIVAYQIRGPDLPINRKRWCRTWNFGSDDIRLIAEQINAQ